MVQRVIEPKLKVVRASNLGSNPGSGRACLTDVTLCNKLIKNFLFGWFDDCRLCIRRRRSGRRRVNIRETLRFKEKRRASSFSISLLLLQPQPSLHLGRSRLQRIRWASSQSLGFYLLYEFQFLSRFLTNQISTTKIKNRLSIRFPYFLMDNFSQVWQ